MSIHLFERIQTAAVHAVVELAINMRRLVTVIIRLYKEVELNVRLLDSDALVEHVYVRLADV